MENTNGPPYVNFLWRNPIEISMDFFTRAGKNKYRNFLNVKSREICIFTLITCSSGVIFLTRGRKIVPKYTISVLLELRNILK
jgi:hypothetical protein